MKPYRISYVTETKFRDKYNAIETKIVLTKRIAQFIEKDNDLKYKISAELIKYKNSNRIHTISQILYICIKNRQHSN